MGRRSGGAAEVAGLERLIETILVQSWAAPVREETAATLWREHQERRLLAMFSTARGSA